MAIEFRRQDSELGQPSRPCQRNFLWLVVLRNIA
jgi:hypothetical protein